MKNKLLTIYMLFLLATTQGLVDELVNSEPLHAQADPCRFPRKAREAYEEKVLKSFELFESSGDVSVLFDLYPSLEANLSQAEIIRRLDYFVDNVEWMYEYFDPETQSLKYKDVPEVYKYHIALGVIDTNVNNFETVELIINAKGESLLMSPEELSKVDIFYSRNNPDPTRLTIRLFEQDYWVQNRGFGFYGVLGIADSRYNTIDFNVNNITFSESTRRHEFLGHLVDMYGEDGYLKRSNVDGFPNGISEEVKQQTHDAFIKFIESDVRLRAEDWNYVRLRGTDEEAFQEFTAQIIGIDPAKIEELCIETYEYLGIPELAGIREELINADIDEQP